jgi:DNA-binding response OmpR family regulator
VPKRLQENLLKARILLIEGNRADHPSFSDGLRKRGFFVQSVRNGTAAQERLLEVDPDIIIVDADSLRTSGKRICQTLRGALDDIPIILIINREEAEKNHNGKANHNETILILPFTIQKLVNRLKPLLPGESKNLMHTGPIRLDIERLRVRCLSNTGNLTPHLVKLLKYLMERPGDVIQRDELFRVVWETDYTQDTRTLDVHISWLRKIIEVDPRKPKFIITVRGVGYRLDI